jgi:hypothetical protein
MNICDVVVCTRNKSVVGNPRTHLDFELRPCTPVNLLRRRAVVNVHFAMVNFLGLREYLKESISSNSQETTTPTSTLRTSTSLPPPQPLRIPIIKSTTPNMSADEEKAKKQREAGEREAARLWRAWRTVHEMVQDRGYELTDEEVKISFDNFKHNYASDGEEDIIE